MNNGIFFCIAGLLSMCVVFAEKRNIKLVDFCIMFGLLIILIILQAVYQYANLNKEASKVLLITIYIALVPIFVMLMKIIFHWHSLNKLKDQTYYNTQQY